MFGSDGHYAGLWGWLYILQQANDGDAIVSSQGRYTTNQTTIAAGVFQRNSAGEIQIIYSNGTISSAEPGAVMSDALFAYAGSSGRTPTGFIHGYYSLRNSSGRQIAGISSRRQNKYLYIDPQEVFLTGLKAGKDIGPVVAGAAVGTGPAAPFVAAAGGIYTAVGYGTWVLTDVINPASQLIVDQAPIAAVESIGTNVVLPAGVDALGYTKVTPYVGTAYDISKLLYGACYGTGCPR